MNDSGWNDLKEALELSSQSWLKWSPEGTRAYLSFGTILMKWDTCCDPDEDWNLITTDAPSVSSFSETQIEKEGSGLIHPLARSFSENSWHFLYFAGEQSRCLWDATDEPFFLLGFWPFPQDEGPVVWYHHCLVCPGGPSGFLGGVFWLERRKLFFWRISYFCAGTSPSSMKSDVNNRIASVWSVLRQTVLYLLQHLELTR